MASVGSMASAGSREQLGTGGASTSADAAGGCFCNTQCAVCQKSARSVQQ